MGIVKNRKIPTIYELGLYGYYGVISLISAILSYPLTDYLMGNTSGNIDFCLSIFMTTLSAGFFSISISILSSKLPLGGK